MVDFWARLLEWLSAAASWRPMWGTHWVEPSNEITRAVLGQAGGPEATPVHVAPKRAAAGRAESGRRGTGAVGEQPAASVAEQSPEAPAKREPRRPVRAA